MAQIYQISNSKKILPDLTKFQYPREVQYWFWNLTGATAAWVTPGGLARLLYESRLEEPLYLCGYTVPVTCSPVIMYTSAKVGDIGPWPKRKAFVSFDQKC
jgi:hypothetical protein